LNAAPNHQPNATPAANPKSERREIIILGVMLNGRAFRPSDWAERLAGIMSTFGGDEQLRYNPYVRPVTMDGVRCVYVSPELAKSDPRAYQFLMDFAKDNDLQVLDPSLEDALAEGDACPVPGAMTRFRD
jgi:hypothetical protein